MIGGVFSQAFLAFLQGSARRVCKIFQERRPWADLIAARGFSFVEAVEFNSRPFF